MNNGTIEGFVDPILINTLTKMVENSTIARSQMMTRHFDRRRNIDDECGFMKDEEITQDFLWRLYRRDPFAARVVEIWPKECFQVQPEVYETEDPNTITAFEEAVNNIGKNLISEPGYQKQESCNVLNDYLLRADIQCGINRYGVMLLLIDDNKELSEPIDGIGSGKIQHILTGIRVYPETLAQIAARETDRKSPRIGMPTLYNITMDSMETDTGIRGSSSVTGTQRVHWTRVVHIVDNLYGSTSEIVGVERMRPVLNNIYSLQKIVSGDGEGFWKGAFPGLSFETHPQLGGDVSFNRSKARDQAEQYMNGLQRYLFLTGMAAKTLSPNIADPTPHIQAQVEAICIKGGYPIPVFKGYEVGENAGSMNTEQWNDRVKQRQNGQCTTRLVYPLYNRLINIGCLPAPKTNYSVYWPDITAETQTDKIKVGQMKTSMIAMYIKSGLSERITFVDFLTKLAGFTDQEARSIAESAQKELAATQKSSISIIDPNKINQVMKQDQQTQQPVTENPTPTPPANPVAPTTP